MLLHIGNDSNAYELWKKFKAMCEKQNAQSKGSLMSKLVKLEFHDGNRNVVHLNEFHV